MEQEYLNTKQAALFLDASRDSIYHWIRTGLLDARKVAGQYLIALSTLKKFVSPRQRGEVDPNI